MNPIDATVFVYRYKKTGEIECAYLDDAIHFQNDAYEHVATLNPLAWIELHYDEIKE
jgi:hypothetical protein